VQEDALEEAFPAQVAQHIGEAVAAVEVGVAVGGEHEQAGGLGERTTCLATTASAGRPTEVIENEDQRVGLGDGGQRGGDCFEEAVALAFQLGKGAASRSRCFSISGTSRRELGGARPSLVSKSSGAQLVT
jgi:hypothetical protein